MASSRKTMFLDLLQLNSLRFYSLSNSPIPSSLVLTSKGNGETYFTSISSIIGNNTHVVSSISFTGVTGRQPVSTFANSGSAIFSTIQTNFSNFASFIDSNGSSRMFIDYYPNITFAPVVAPSSISSLALYPEGNSSIKSLLSLSSHFIFVDSTGSNVPIIKTGIQQYIPVNSFYPYAISSSLTVRPLSNNFITPMRLEFDTSFINSNVGLVHHISDGMGSIKSVGGNDVFRTGLETSTIVINTNLNDKNVLFVNISNSGNAF